MIPHLKPKLLSALFGFLVGLVWEGFGATYLWVLASPELLVFVLAMIAWSLLGLATGIFLGIVEVVVPRYKRFLKPLAGPSALITASITNQMGLISYRIVGPSIFGVPLYMMTGWLALVYILDLLGWHRKA